MVAWQYVLNGAQEDPTMALWKDWRVFSGTSLSLEKPMVGKGTVIRFENVSFDYLSSERTALREIVEDIQTDEYKYQDPHDMFERAVRRI